MKDKPTYEAVVIAFQDRGCSDIKEAQKFFAHYEANGWKQSNGRPIVKWKMAVAGWLLRMENFTTNAKGKKVFRPWFDKKYWASLDIPERREYVQYLQNEKGYVFGSAPGQGMWVKPPNRERIWL